MSTSFLNIPWSRRIANWLKSFTSNTQLASAVLSSHLAGFLVFLHMIRDHLLVDSPNRSANRANLIPVLCHPVSSVPRQLAVRDVACFGCRKQVEEPRAREFLETSIQNIEFDGLTGKDNSFQAVADDGVGPVQS